MARAPRQTQTPHDPDTGEVLEPRGQGRQEIARVPAQITFGQGVDDDFEIERYVTVPMLDIPPGVPFTAQMADQVHVLPKIEGYPTKIKGDHWANTVKAPNGEARLLTWSTVFRSEMEKAYPDHSYVGKWFRITKMQIKPGKDYWTYSIVQLRPRFQTIDAEAA